MEEPKLSHSPHHRLLHHSSHSEKADTSDKKSRREKKEHTAENRSWVETHSGYRCQYDQHVRRSSQRRNTRAGLAKAWTKSPGITVARRDTMQGTVPRPKRMTKRGSNLLMAIVWDCPYILIGEATVTIRSLDAAIQVPGHSLQPRSGHL